MTKAEVPKFGQTPKAQKSKTMKLSKKNSEIATRGIVEVTSGENIQRLMNTKTITRTITTTTSKQVAVNN